MLEVEERSNQGCCHSASYGTKLSDEGAKEPERELAALVGWYSRLDLAAEILDHRAWDPKLHASGVHVQAGEPEQLGWDHCDLVGVDTEAEGVQRIDRDLRVANQLSLVACHQDDVVDVPDRADAEPS